MERRGIVKYVLLSAAGVAILYIVPFIIAQKYISGIGQAGAAAILSSTGFTISFKNTVVFMAAFVPASVILGFLLAFATEYMHLSFWVQAAVILPITVPAVSVAGFFRETVGRILELYGGGIYVIGIIFLWGSIGYAYIIYLISLRNRDRTIEEAAFLDGAGTVRTLFTIVMPMHTEALVLSTVISIYNSLKIFRFTYAMYGEYPDYRIFMMQNFLHIKLKELSLDTLMVSADVFLMFILIILLLVLGAGRLSKRRLDR